MIKIPEHILSINPYVPGKPIEELERELGISNSVKLASNENPAGASPLALKELRRGLSDLHRYPDGSCYYLGKALSNHLQISPENILFGNGSNEIIELAIRTIMRPGDTAIMAHPSFVVYSLIVQAAQGRSILVPLKEQKHDLETMASRVTKKTRIIFIANPNNPTGTINTKKELAALIQRIPKGVLVVIDEAYCEYVMSPDYADSMKYLKQGKDILILRTFSKIYGLAGLRIGYGMGSRSLIGAMNRIRQPFNVNTLSQKAALAALSDEKHLKRSIKINEQGKKFLYRELEKMDLDFVPTEANFIFVPLKKNSAQKVYTSLLQKGVIVRPMGSKALRLTIGLPGENKRLIEALKHERHRF
ncbi:MAG: histidinol-phosphate transaminase [Nitrospiraceae bacterium]|nr:MAG: histidinol-phosphate transaminase [Nitrospiraceae bacterium]